MGREAWSALLDIFGGKCLKCETPERLEADHVLPVHLGGTNDLGNFQPLCRTCNAAKGATYADYRTSKQIEAVERYKRAMVEAMFPAVKIVEV
ncbi:HNH endonuclease [Sinorhizobium meliloti]|nr:HNH endonuclease [Sinorhizobium meliloti]RVQ55779.1 HNH endonuclease [Sinorhizobium meliloti]